MDTTLISALAEDALATRVTFSIINELVWSGLIVITHNFILLLFFLFLVLFACTQEIEVYFFLFVSTGVATFCKDSATPFAAEEGLTGRLVNHGEAVGCYGDQGDFSIEELQSLDNEGRAVITQHKFKHSL